MEFVAAIIITEIMYNPDSNERPPAQTEWVELYNTSEQTVDISGWYLADEDGKTQPLGENVTIEPGEAIVLIPAAQTVEDFRAAWGEGFDVYPLEGWSTPAGMRGLANGPSEKNELLRLCNAEDEAVDEVNYDDEGDWPSDRPDGPSISLLPDKLSAKANDAGKSWQRSEAGKLGAGNAKETEEYSAEDVGSPGKVVTEKEAEQAETDQAAQA